MALLNASQLRNPSDEEEPEYLLCAMFHDDAQDDRGYVTTVWTPMSVLQSIEDPHDELAAKVEAYLTHARESFTCMFGRRGAFPRTQPPAPSAPSQDTQLPA